MMASSSPTKMIRILKRMPTSRTSNKSYHQSKKRSQLIRLKATRQLKRHFKKYLRSKGHCPKQTSSRAKKIALFSLETIYLTREP